MKHRIPWCFVSWMAAAFIVSVCIRDEIVVKFFADKVAFFSILATWWGFHQTQYPLRQILLHRFVFAAVFLGLIWYDLPLKAVFWACRPFFERAASQLESGVSRETPFWIGPFRINYAGMKNGVPYLGTRQGEWEIEGFVRHPEGEGFNLWSYENLDRNWAYIVED